MKSLISSFSLVAALACAPHQASAGPLLIGTDLLNLTVFSKTYTTTGANSKVFGDVLAGGVSTTGANAQVLGNLTSTGAATTGGAGSSVSGNIVSGDVLTTGDHAVVGGNITSSGASTIGAHARVGGNMVSGGVATTGDTSIVSGSIQAGGAASTGANSIVTGAVKAVGLISISASSTVGSQQTLSASPIAPVPFTNSISATVTSDALQVAAAQSALWNLGTGTALLATITTDRTLVSGVYSAASLSTTAGTTLTLDGQGIANAYWVFNITDILAIGASTTINTIHLGANPTVIWNVGAGYASLGDTANFIGTILADTYISVGANAIVHGVGNTCGGVFSQTSYVSTGDAAEIGGRGCTGSSSGFSIADNGVAVPTPPAVNPGPTTSVPEPATWALLLSGFLLVGAVRYRRT